MCDAECSLYVLRTRDIEPRTTPETVRLRRIDYLIYNVPRLNVVAEVHQDCANVILQSLQQQRLVFRSRCHRIPAGIVK